MPSNLQPFDHLLRLHDAPLHDAAWQQAYGAFATHFGDVRVGMLLRQGTPPDNTIVFGVASDEALIREYVDEFAAMSPLATPEMLRRLLTQKNPQRFEDLINPESFARSEFYERYWQRHGDLASGLLACREIEPGLVASFSFLAPRGSRLDDNAGEVFSRLIQVSVGALRHRVHAEQRMKLEKALSATGRTTADALWLVDAEGRTLFRNDVAERLERSHSMIASGDRLRLEDGNGDDILQQICRGERELAGSLHTVVSTGDMGSPQLASILSLDPGRKAGEPCCAVMVRPPPRIGAAIAEAIPFEALFGFTAAERRVAVAMLQGMDAEQIARHQGVRTDTVRHHIKRMMTKTDCRRQAMLLLKLREATPPAARLQLSNGSVSGPVDDPALSPPSPAASGR